MPVAFGLRGGGGRSPCGGAPTSGLADNVERSSGAPGPRPPGAPTGASATAGGRSTGGGGSAPGGTVPNGRGTPGAPGLSDGSNTSDRRPGGDGAVAICGGGGNPGRTSGRLGAEPT